LYWTNEKKAKKLAREAKQIEKDQKLALKSKNKSQK
jgi:hypothetical protein